MKVQLPSGRVVSIEPGGGAGEARRTQAARGRDAAAPRKAEGPNPPLFQAFREACATRVRVREGDAKLDVGSLALCDFHALRAIVTRQGWLSEEPVDITCRNCGAPMAVLPCAALPLGPFVDHELHDPELDTTLPFGEAHEAPELGAVVLAARTADEAKALHVALARPHFRVTPAVVKAMGIARVGDDENPAKIAALLQRASDRAWDALADLFLAAHYPPRLFSPHVCSKCGARNDVDAPYDRELEPGASHEESEDSRALSAKSNEDPFPSFDEFDGVAKAIAAPFLAKAVNEGVVLVVDDGVPACDDGGEPLLGSYVPGYAGDMSTPSRAPEVSLFYRTFRAIWDEEGPYDWRGELHETIEHELEHHEGALLGDDPTDDEERAEIVRERARVLGKREALRREIRGGILGLSGDFSGFLRRTWPIWLLVLLATLAIAYADVR